MTAKEKAKELVGLFRPHCRDDNGDRFSERVKERTLYAKDCAIVCVNEIIQVVISAYHKLGCGEIGTLEHYIPYIYWNEVKEEISKL